MRGNRTDGPNHLDDFLMLQKYSGGPLYKQHATGSHVWINTVIQTDTLRQKN